MYTLLPTAPASPPPPSATACLLGTLPPSRLLQATPSCTAPQPPSRGRLSPSANCACPSDALQVRSHQSEQPVGCLVTHVSLLLPSSSAEWKNVPHLSHPPIEITLFRILRFSPPASVRLFLSLFVVAGTEGSPKFKATSPQYTAAAAVEGGEPDLVFPQRSFS